MTRSRRSVPVLALGSALNGLLAYLLFALVTRGLGAEGSAPVTVLWTLWAFAGAALTFPVQHWVAATVARDGEGAVRHALPSVLGWASAAALLLGGLSWMAADSLFHRGGPAFPAMVAAITLGAAVVGVTRGGLAARGRFSALALELVLENTLRCLLVAALLVAGVHNPAAHGLALVAGQLIVVAWPSALRFGTEGRAAAGEGPFAYLAGAGFAQLVSQCLLTGAPVVVALAGGSAAEVTALFAGLALFRAPYLLSIGVMPTVTARATVLVLDGDAHTLRRADRAVLAAGVLGALAAAVFGSYAGPWLLRTVFGSDVDLAPHLAAMVAAGCTLAVANLVLVVLGLAHRRPGGVARAWGAGIVAAVVLFGVLTGDAVSDRTTAAFLLAEAVAFAGLQLVSTRSVRALAGSTRPLAAP